MTCRTTFAPTLAGFAVAVAAAVFLVVNAPAGEMDVQAGAALYGSDALAYFTSGEPAEGAAQRKAHQHETERKRSTPI